MAALVAAAAYTGAVYAGVSIVRSALEDDAPGLAATSVAPVVATGVRASEDLALQARAARAQQAVYRLEAANGATGSAFVAWTVGRRTFLLTARSLVAPALADGARRVFLRRGNRVWGGRVWGVHKASGLAAIWVDGPLAKPLWQQPRRSEPLRADAPVVLLPGGPGAAIGDGRVRSVKAKQAVLAAPTDELAVGSPVIARNGRIAGVVVAATGRTHTVAAIERACATLRAC